MVNFVFDPRFVQPGIAYITVTGAKAVPKTVEIPLEAPDLYMQYDNEYTYEEINGNDDGFASPHERARITIFFKNIGSEALDQGLRVSLNQVNDQIQVLAPNAVVINEAIAPGARSSASWELLLTSSFPDRTPVSAMFSMTHQQLQRNWSEQIELFTDGEGHAPNIVATTIAPNGALIPNGAAVRLEPTFENQGSILFAQMNVFLDCLMPNLVNFVGRSANYDTLAGGRKFSWKDGDRFEFNVTNDAAAHKTIPFKFIFSVNEEGVVYTYTTYFDLPVKGQAGGVNPDGLTGPDRYGYYAIDDQDIIHSNLTPVYNWLEINPLNNGPGQILPLLDQGEDNDKSLVVDLPFPFQYYGVKYNKITICTNGWAAFGDQASYVDFRNQPIGSAGGPEAQLCPWWDDLYFAGNEEAICTYYDKTLKRFIIEWYKMKRWIGPGGPGKTETFQAILYDPVWHPSKTGDGDIVFQYRDMTNSPNVDGNGTPYATIGINAPSDTTGLQYSYWNSWAAGARPLIERSAIRFATASRLRFGAVSGTVVENKGDNAPIPNAVVHSSIGGWAVTNAEGQFTISNIIASRNFKLTVTAPGYKGTESIELRVNEGALIDTLEYKLLHPVITVNREDIVDSLSGDRFTEDYQIALSNQGDAPLDYSIRFVMPEGAPDNRWRWFRTYFASDSTADDRLMGVIYADEHYYVAGGNNGEQSNFLYKFNSEFAEMEKIQLPIQGVWGLHDLAWDGTFLYGGSEDKIYRMTLAGEDVKEFPSPVNPNRAIAVDPVTKNMWVTGESAEIFCVDSTGEVVASYKHNLKPHALAWNPVDETSSYLYILSADGNTRIALSKMNTETGEVTFVKQLPARPGDFPGSCEITYDIDTRNWTLLMLTKNVDGDRIELYDAGQSFQWVKVDKMVGALEPDAQENIVVSVDSRGLEWADFAADMLITDLTTGAVKRLPIRINLPEVGVSDGGISPIDFRLHPVYPNPTNGTGMIRFDLPKNEMVTVSIFDQNGRLVTNLLSTTLTAGNHTHLFKADSLSSGIYFIRLTAGTRVQNVKFVLLK